MRVLIFIALCLAVASAGYTSRSRFNRLLRSLQHQQPQDQEQGLYGSRYLNNQYDQDEQLEDDEDQYQQQCQRRGQCPRGQRYGGLSLDDDETEYESYEQEDDQDQDQYWNQYQNQQQQGQGRRQHRQQPQQQQQRRQQQQRHQCQPRFQLLQALEQTNTQLASKLYQQAKQENDDKNTVVSPAALHLALAAIQRGARGNTKRQIQRIISAGLTKQQQRQAHAALQQSLQGQDQQQQQHQYGQNQQAKVKTTTTIIINQRNHAQHQFIQAVQACLNVQVKKCDFQRQPQQCRQQINRHIAQKTQHNLKQTVPQDAVTENTKMIVVSTAQIQAKWGRQFRQQQTTKQGRFYPLGSQQPKHVQVLQSQGQFNYYEDEQLQVVGVPTQQQELTMYVIVPKNKDGLNQVEKTKIQQGEQLKQLLEQAEQQQEQVRIELPKFQIKHKLDAKQTLRKQGVQDVFDADQADLSGINGQQEQDQEQEQYRRRRQQPYEQDFEDQYQQQGQDDEQQQRQQQLHINKLIQQATIKIDEQGIKAARPGRQGQQQQYQQYQQYPEQDEEQDQDDEDDEQEQQYFQQQYQRQDTFEQIFGQRQRQQRQRRHQRHQRPQYQQQQQQQQYQDQDDEDQYNRYNQYGEQSQYNQYGEQKQVRANRAFAFAIKHNPSNQIVLVGRVVDATQKPHGQQQQQQYGQRQQQGQTLNGVDQQ